MRHQRPVAPLGNPDSYQELSKFPLRPRLRGGRGLLSVDSFSDRLLKLSPDSPASYGESVLTGPLSCRGLLPPQRRQGWQADVAGVHDDADARQGFADLAGRSQGRAAGLVDADILQGAVDQAL